MDMNVSFGHLMLITASNLWCTLLV